MGDVTILGMDAITEKSGHSIVPMAVSVCITPAAPSPLPIPYPVVGSSIEGITDSPMRTKFNGAIIATVGSVIKTCHGNEPGTLKEVVSLNTAGPCALILGAPNVLIELGMAGITGSVCVSNKAPTPGAGGSGSNAGGTGGAGGGGGEGSGSGGNASGPGGPGGGGGAGGGGSNSGASGPGSSSAPADEHTCQDGHPVNVVTGHVVDQATDLLLPGLIPLVWKRYYSSARRQDTTATLGPGWAHGFEQRITEDERLVTLRDGEGRSIYFARINPGETTFHRRERMSLSLDAEGVYRVFSAKSRLTQVFSKERAGGAALLAEIRDAYNNALRLEYDGARLIRVIETAGRELRLRWERGRITRVEVHAERTLEQWVDYGYSSSGCLVSAVDALGGADEYEYDRFNRMTATTIKSGVRFQYEYEHGTGRCERTWGPDGLYAIELRADRKAQTTTVEGEEPRVYSWNDQGLMTREALPDGTVIEERAYDDDGFLVALVNGAGEGEQYWYDARGNRIRTVDAAGNVMAVEYDENDLPVRRITADGLVTTFVHDGKGALSGVSVPTGESYSLTYDDRGRMTGVYNQNGLVRGFEYDGLHNVIAETDARGARTTFAYDGMGRPLTRTDALGRVTRVTYDRLGRRLSIRFPDGSMTQASHDAMGNVVREVDPLGQASTMEYAGMGVLASLVQPDGRAWSFKYTSKERLKEIKNPRGEVYAFKYDEAGKVVEEKTFDGRVLDYDWSAAGRLAKIAYPDKSWRAFFHDRRGNIVSEEASDKSTIVFQRDRMGRIIGATLTEERGARHTTLFERDALGRVVVERQGDRAIRYGYDARGRRALRVMPDGATTRYAYDTADALAMVEHNGHQLAFERDALGREIQRGDREGRLSIRSAYDVMDRLIEQRATAPSPGEGVPAVLVQRQWQYGRGGRVMRIDDGRWGATAYQYDKLGNLVEAARGTQREVFAYDGAGSLVKALDGLVAQPDARAGAWKIAPGNLLEQTDRTKYAYDKRGRRSGQVEVSKFDKEKKPARAELTTYTWDVRDRLSEVKLPSGVTVKMAYDAFGRRVQKTVLSAEAGSARTVEFVWDGDALAADIDSERGSRCFVHVPGTLTPLLQQERGEVMTYVNDHLGTPKELIDPAGLVAWSAHHSAWGKVVDTQSNPLSELNRGRKVSSPFRLLGQCADEETGLCYTRFRYFDPEVGRWCSPDPLGIEGGMDLFGFDGCPTNEVDPLGLASGSPHNVTAKNRKEAFNMAKDRAGIPRSQQPEQSGSFRPRYPDRGTGGAGTNVHEGDAASQGRWYKFRKDDGSTVYVVEHDKDPTQKPHFHAVETKAGHPAVDKGGTYSPIDGKHHIFY